MKKQMKDLLLNSLTMAGFILAAHHGITYGRLKDENSELCHGDIGLELLSIGLPLTSVWIVSKLRHVLKK